ncbi:GNAT family N-acetyltransferase [Nocardioides insulae]|uniref:GNAT family N-acetyltransferase n=1 Tax=Nocardioides insulae TaxID=394734 RepID=UPI00055BC4E7|nr:GNAT family N-acetyltransferase [Nocardioides insulae]
MLWRVRTTLPDRPGALAVLAARCGEAGVNILGLQIFPGIEEVTDELILRTPEQWTTAEVGALLDSAGGRAVVALPCTESALTDQPARYVQAARALLARPTAFPEILADLFDAEPDPVNGTGHDTLEVTLRDVTMQVHRAAPFTPTERARGEALAAVVDVVLSRAPSQGTGSVTTTVAASGRGEVEHLVGVDSVRALIGGEVVGTASVGAVIGRDLDGGEVRDVDLSVETGWQRQGIGSGLLLAAARLAQSKGAAEVRLVTWAGNPAVLPMTLGAGLRARIRMSGDELVVRLPVSDLRPLRS